MIINFQFGSELLSVRVDEHRELCIKSRLLTNGEWLNLEEVARRTGKDGTVEERLSKRIISCRHCLQSDSDVECFVRNEFLRDPVLQSYGIRWVNTV
jgi:hypothetical protein